jgi:photosystem II stability/assembly factor-like uncharacterized protein
MKIRRTYFILCIAILSFGRYCSLYSQSWVSNGPYYKVINAITHSPIHPDILYSGAFGSGVFKTTDGGASWKNQDNGMTNKYVRSILAVSDDTVYVGTNDGIFKTTDGGSLWTNSLSTPKSVRSIAYDQKTGSVYAATYGTGLYKSTNQGTSWSPINIHDGTVNRTLSRLWSVVVFGRDSLYVGGSISDVSIGGALFESFNGGTTWYQVQWKAGGAIRSSVKSIAINPNNPASKLIIGTASLGVYESTNGGGKWTVINAGTTPNPLFDKKINVVSYTNGFRYAGTDSAGKLFYQSLADVSNGWLSGTGLPGTQAVITSIDNNPTNRNIVFLGTEGQGVYKSIDSGSTWQSSGNEMLGTAARTVEINGNGNIILGAGFGDGIWISNDQAASWTRADTLTTSSSVTAIGITNVNTTVYAAIYGSGVHKSLDGGNIWHQTDTAALNPYTRSLIVHPSNSNIVYAGTGNGVFKTTNGGTSWFSSSNGMPPTTSIRSMAINLIDPNVIYAGTDSVYMYKTTDAGAHWNQISYANGFYIQDQFIRTITVNPLHSNVVYAGVDSGRIYKSTDSGTSWNLLVQLPITHSIRKVIIHPYFNKILLAGTFGDGIFASTDGGMNWSSFNTGLNDLEIYAVASDESDPMNLYACTASHGVFHTTVKATDSTLSVDPYFPIVQEFELHQNFPNPFNPSTTLSYFLPKRASVNLSIYNILGQEVAEVFEGVQGSGYYSTTWNAQNMTSGVFFSIIRISDSETGKLLFRAAKKLMLLK